jgi:uncharacterized protein YkwD
MARLWPALAIVVCVGILWSPQVAGTTGTASNDGVDRWLAGERACPGSTGVSVPAAAQRRALLCLVNVARARAGLRPLIADPVLAESAAAKAADIARCQDFAHDPCGTGASRAARALGYRGAWGENLYIGTGRLGTPRAAMEGWLSSPGHRENLFRPQLRSSGIARRAGASTSAGGRRITGAVLWVHQFGS